MEKCQLKGDFEEHIKKDEENDKRIRNTLHSIRNDLQRIENKVEDHRYVELKNGGGRLVRYKREDFAQMLYDNMKWKMKDIFKDIALVISVLTAIFAVIKMLWGG